MNMSYENEAICDSLTSLLENAPALQRALLRSLAAGTLPPNEGLTTTMLDRLSGYATFLGHLNVALLIALGRDGSCRILDGYDDLDRLLGRPDWSDWQLGALAWEAAEDSIRSQPAASTARQDLLSAFGECVRRKDLKAYSVALAPQPDAFELRRACEDLVVACHGQGILRERETALHQMLGLWADALSGNSAKLLRSAGTSRASRA